MTPDGDKLSKRNASPTVRSLLASGVLPEALVGWLAQTLGLADGAAPVSAGALVERFVWEHVPREPVVVSPGFLLP